MVVKFTAISYKTFVIVGVLVGRTSAGARWVWQKILSFVLLPGYFWLVLWVKVEVVDLHSLHPPPHQKEEVEEEVVVEEADGHWWRSVSQQLIGQLRMLVCSATVQVYGGSGASAGRSGGCYQGSMFQLSDRLCFLPC